MIPWLPAAAVKFLLRGPGSTPALPAGFGRSERSRQELSSTAVALPAAEQGERSRLPQVDAGRPSEEVGRIREENPLLPS